MPCMNVCILRLSRYTFFSSKVQSRHPLAASYLFLKEVNKNTIMLEIKAING